MISSRYRVLASCRVCDGGLASLGRTTAGVEEWACVYMECDRYLEAVDDAGRTVEDRAAEFKQPYRYPISADRILTVVLDGFKVSAEAKGLAVVRGPKEGQALVTDSVTRSKYIISVTKL